MKRAVVAASIVATAVTAAVAAVVRVRTSPWPSVRVIRFVFDRDARKTVAEMERHAPAGAFRERRDVPYAASGSRRAPHHASSRFDLIAPAAAAGPVPVVVWIHGGAWISGDKAHVVPYLRHLASAGFAGVALDYTIAPEAAYPTALHQLNDALAHLVTQADELGIDPGRIVLAGDSAGAQLASQLTAAIVDPAVAAGTGIRPALAPEQLRGVVLHCGIYDLGAMTHLTGVLEWGFRSALWAYTGRRDWSESPAAASMSTIDAVSSAFPPAFVSGGNGDGLTAIQSVALAERMRAAGVPVTTRFWAPDHEPSLPHEYQFKLDFADARQTLEDTVAFLREVTTAGAAPGPAADSATGPATGPHPVPARRTP